MENTARASKLQDRLNEARELKQVLCRKGLPLLDTQDPLRLVLHSGSAGISGVEADDWLLPRGWWRNCLSRPHSPSALAWHGTVDWPLPCTAAGDS